VNKIKGTANRLTKEELDITLWKAYLDKLLDDDFPHKKMRIVFKPHQDNARIRNLILILIRKNAPAAHNESSIKWHR
jgi:hypothetical protein